MKLSVRNIGKLKSAEIDIAGITVVAGENNTGKSTLGKALFAVFNGFHDPEKQVKGSKERSMETALAPLRRASDIGLEWHSLGERVAKQIVRSGVSSTSDLEALVKNEFIDSGFPIDEGSLSESISLIQKRLEISDEEALKACMTKWFEAEFGSQVNNIYTDEPGMISLEIQGERADIEIESDVVKAMTKVFHLGASATYLDDPFAIDEPMGLRRYPADSAIDHREKLVQSLSGRTRHQNVYDEIIVSDKLSAVESLLNSVCAGDVVQKGFRLGYVEPGSSDALQMGNLSAGLKTFAIVKRLLQNGVLKENGTIILDEPEIHLHPEWQLLFAELIVLLQKKFGMHILLTTHSPYFLNALEVYSEKHGINSSCRYYLAKNNEGGSSEVINVTGDLEQVYSMLARPFQILEDEMYS
jgi:predicted ATPase